MIPGDFFFISSDSPINKQVICFIAYYRHSRFIQGIKYNDLRHWQVRIIYNKTYHDFRGRNIFKKQTQTCIFLNKMHIS